ncbi:MAG TPA: carboxypeptidase regulatory-like domain-containing protein [Acidisarcina sp.]
MKLRSLSPSLPALVLLLAVGVLTIATPRVSSQTPAPPSASGGNLHGTVADPTGAVIPQASITVTSASGKVTNAVSGGDGTYEVLGLPPGSYIVHVVETGFAGFTSAPITLAAGQSKRVDVSLAIQMEQQRVVVTDDTPTVSIDAGNNASSLVIKGKDLDALSDDPDELSSELTALAGPSAGPNGGQIYIDGFTGGELPPKSAIREIRVNQNPFSAEYDRLGYGRIEILTKPGTDKLHGQAFIQGNANFFNSKNPFACTQANRLGETCNIPDYHSLQYDANLSDAIGKNASFFFNFDRRQVQDDNIVNAITFGGTDCSNPTGPAPTPGATYSFSPCSVAVQAPSFRMNISPRVDLQFGANSTVTIRYQYESTSNTNAGIGQFNLAGRAYNGNSHENTLEFGETQVLSPRVINETHARFQREVFNQTPVSTAPGISVSGAFYTGGNPTQQSNDTQTRWELQNYTSLALTNHNIKFGGRLRVTQEASVSNANFNGSFSFGARPCPASGCPTAGETEISGLQAFQITQQGLAAGESGAQIRAAGGGASQYTVNSGNPSASANLVDLGLYVQDDWKVRPNFSLSTGLRWETQNYINDQSDFAPRLGFAYGIGGGGKGTPKTVLRGGYGIFYDRFALGQILQAQRQSGSATTGIVQTIVNNPDSYPNPAAPGTGGSAVSSIYQIYPKLHSPYTMQFGIGVDRQLTRSATLSVTYLNSRGVHQLLTRDANAPLPGTYDPQNPGAAVRPNLNAGNIYQYYSEGIFKQNQLIVNFNVRAGSRLTLFGFYQLGQADSDTSGVGSFAAHPYDISEDYGRATFNARNRLFIGGTVTTKYNFRLSPFLVTASGSPYNITTSEDLNGDGIFNDRPAFAGTCTPNAVTESCFNPNPAPSASEIPVNFANGPSQFTLNLRASKTIGIGPKLEHAENAGQNGAGGPPSGGPLSGGMGGPGRGGPGGGRGGPGGGGPGGPAGGTSDRRYNLTFNVQARNIFNNVNYATPSGQLDSPLFGKSNALGGAFGGVATSANRRIDLQMVFSF